MSREVDALLQFDRVRIDPSWNRRRRRGRDGTFVRYAYGWFGSAAVTAADRWAATKMPRAHRGVVGIINALEPLIVYRPLPRGRGTLLGFRRPTPFTEVFHC